MGWLFTSSSSSVDDGNIEEKEAQKTRNHISLPDLADTDGVILVGHSVGATIAFGMALGLGLGDHRHEKANGFQALRKKVKAVVGVEGIYDFTALRDAHGADDRDVYEEFTTGAFGEEKGGAWERGNVGRMVMEGVEMMEGVEVVVLGQSRGDGLVEWGQVEGMERALRERGGWRGGDEDGEGAQAKEVTVVELEGGHDEVWERGEGLARCITVAVERCVRRNSGGGC